MEAVKIKKPSVIGLQGGGSRDVFPGDVIFVGKGQELSEDDGRYLIAGDRAEECDRTDKKKSAEKK